MLSPQRPGPALYNVGTVLNNGRYKIERKLNKGATAVVYAATDRHSGRHVALKVVQCGSNKVPVSVVRREVALSSSVAHENMVQLLDVFSEGTELIIVWELIAGPDLLELLNEANGRMSEAAAAFYFVQLLRGVLHMHAMGWSHRDIKPENCMVERSTQRLKLIDFGLSKHLESVATLGVGTPDYMPPEMVRSSIKSSQRPQQQAQQPQSQQPHPYVARDGIGEDGQGPLHPQHQHQQQQQHQAAYDARAVDAWAMGVLLYLLVSGTYPFEDPDQPNNLAATILQIQAGRCRPLPDSISVGCRSVIAGLLEPDPRARTRLEDLACTPWLLQAAAAHVTRLGPPLSSRFDAGNPDWILPTTWLDDPFGRAAPAAAAAAASPSNAAPAAAAAPAAGMPPGSQQRHLQQQEAVGQQAAAPHGLIAPSVPRRAQQPSRGRSDSGNEMTLDDMDVDQQPGSSSIQLTELAAAVLGAAAPAGASGMMALNATAAPTVEAASGSSAANAAAGAGQQEDAPVGKRGLTWLVPSFMRRCI